MNIICWNVNGIRAAEKKGFHSYLEKSNPDIFCVQETKASPDQLGASLLEPFDYKSYWSSSVKKGYSGTAIYSKVPLDIRYMKIKKFDDEGRVLVAEFKYKGKTITLINAYFPNSQEGGQRLDYKLEFCKAMLKFCNSISTPLILCGDYNIAHKEIDLARPKENETSPGYLPEERAWMDQFIGAGYIDSFRSFNKEPHNYTWWSYRSAAARANNVGWRIDYFCTNKSAEKIVKSCSIESDIQGSDHCPISLELS